MHLSIVAPNVADLSRQGGDTMATAVDEVIIVDLCGSAYDTKTYIYDDDFHLVACNDDYYFGEPCGICRSRIDGYGSEHGEYILSVEVREPCELACPDGGVPEGATPTGLSSPWDRPAPSRRTSTRSRGPPSSSYSRRTAPTSTSPSKLSPNAARSSWRSPATLPAPTVYYPPVKALYD